MPHEPRPYQSSAIVSLRTNFAGGKRRQLLVAPTGAGKTTIAAIMIATSVEKGKRIWFLAHRRELINQCSRRLDDHNVDHGVIQAKHPRFKPWEQVQVVSVHTVTRGGRLEKLDPPDLIIVDEAHRSLAKSYLDVFAAFPRAAVIGLTATPWRLDGKPLGDHYEELVLVARPQELIDLGYLLAPRVYAPSSPDLSGVKKAHGDYNSKQLAERMRDATIVGDVVSHWQKLVEPSGNPLSVLFAVNKAHSIVMRDRFRDSGIAAAHLDESSTVAERDQVLADLASGRVKVVCNCEILTEGWDLPQLGSVILTRPTQSLVLYLQMAGRGMRTFEGKDSWLLMDHAGCVLEHGFPQEHREYSLDVPAKKKKRKEDDEVGVTVCENCFAIFPSKIRICPECGHKREVQERRVKEDREGSLQELTPEELKKIRVKKAREIPWNERVGRLAGLYVQADEKGYKQAWAHYKFREDVGQWPPGKMCMAAELRAKVLLNQRRREVSLG